MTVAGEGVCGLGVRRLRATRTSPNCSGFCLYVFWYSLLVPGGSSVPSGTTSGSSAMFPLNSAASQLRLFFSRARRFAARAGGTCVVGVSTDLTVRRDRVVSRDSTVSSGARAMTVSSTPRFLTKSSFSFLLETRKQTSRFPCRWGHLYGEIRLETTVRRIFK